MIAGSAGSGECRFRASFAQERLWLLDRLRPGTATYNMPILLESSSRIRQKLLERALEALTERHETLRTAFATEGGTVYQRVLSNCPVTLGFADLRRFPAIERESRAAALIASESRRPFDLALPPLLRTTHLRLGARDDRLLLVMHHIISDAWSVDVVIRELAELYSAFDSGRPPPLEPLAVQYADWAAWQRARFESGSLDGDLAFWRMQLAELPDPLDFPAERRRGVPAGPEGATDHFTIPDALTRALTALAGQTRCTLNMVLYAAFAVLLGRHSRREEFLVGSPVTNRGLCEIEGVVGLFVNTVLLRTDLGGDPTVRTLLERARRTVLDAQDHSQLPLEQVVGLIDPGRSMAGTAPFQALFSFQAGDPPARRGPEAVPLPAGSTRPPETATAKFEISLLLCQVGDRLAGAWEYATDRFDPDRLARMTRHYLRILEAFVEDPDRAIAQIDLLDERERRAIERLERGDALPRRDSDTIHARFIAQASAAPAAIALEVAGRKLSYAELETRSRLLADRLTKAGARPGSLIGLCAMRDADMVVACLAILRCGAAYVPLDPSHPPERIAHIVADAGVELIAAQTELRGVLAAGPAILALDVPEDAPAAPDSTFEARRESLAYVLYTSGTTGRPKGVAVPHCAVTAFLDWAAKMFSKEERARMLASTSICFDLSVFELFLPLTTGGTVVLVDDVLALAEPDAPDVSLVNTVPSAMRELVRLWHPPAGLRTINLAGEVLAGDLADTLARTAPGTRIVNLYGPTETTIYSTAMDVAPESGREPSIGGPIAGTHVRVLDDALNRVPLGVAGELYIGGAGLARGYLNRPALTAGRYLPDPFADRPGSRMYRTGDLVRWTSNGELEFLGRVDQQIKLRGYRIETGEIEAVLRQHPEVLDAVVMLTSDEAGDQKLVAGLVTEGGAPIELDRSAYRGLPDYMIPARLFFTPAFPRTATGKVDRARIRVPSESHALPSRAPASPGEALICEIFAAALGLPAFDPEHSFFAAGGHSLLAARVLATVNDVLAVELPLSALFEHPSPSALALRAERAERAAKAGDRQPVEASGAAVPLTYGQDGMWFYERLQPGTSLYNVPILLRLGAEPDAAALQRAIDEVVARHDALRLRFDEVDGRAVQQIDDSLRVELMRVRLPPGAVAEGIQEAVSRETGRPFDLRRGPPMRAMLLDAGTDHLLALVLHHIVCDGRSTEILAEHLADAYAALRTGAGGMPTSRRAGYLDFARWQRQTLTDGRVEAHVAGFRAELKGAPSVLELPSDRPPPQVPTFKGGVVPIRLDPATTRRVAAVAARSGATAHSFYLAAFALMLSQLSRGEDVVIGVPVANRSRTDWRDIVGLFMNTLPVCIHTGDTTTSFADLLCRAGSSAAHAYAHEELPFDLLVQRLNPDRRPGRHPIFQVLFGYQQQEGALDFAWDSIPTTGTAKFDLSINLTVAANGGFGLLEYSADLFDRETAGLLAGYFRTIVVAAAEDPQASLEVIGAPGQVVSSWLEGVRERPAKQQGADQAPAEAAPGPRDPGEPELAGRIAAIWEEVLGHSDFSAGDSFFEVGGHSLSAMVMVARIAEGGIDIPLETVFATPTIDGLVSAAQACRESAAAPSATARKAVAVDRSGRLPLSFAQERLWTLDQLNPNSAVYNIPLVLRFAAEIDRPALRRSLERLAERHEALRTRFPADLAGPAQRIDPVTSFALPCSDLTELAPAARAAEARRLQMRDARLPFDLGHGPLLRARLVKLADDDLVLLLVIHHIAADARSIEILRRDLLLLYEEESGGRPAKLPDLEVQYADFAVRQREQLRGDALKRQLDFWRERLAGAPELLSLPTDRPRPRSQDHRGRQLGFGFGNGTEEAVRRLASEEGATAFMVLLAVYGALLAQWAQQDEVVIGAPVIARPGSEFEEVVGFFSNSLPLRLRMKASVTFRDLVRQARLVTIEALAHQDVPFEMIVQEVQPDRSTAHNPLFQAMLAYQRGDPADARGGAPGTEPESTSDLLGSAKFDLTLFLADGERMSGAFEYRTDLFDDSTIARFAGRFRQFISAAADAPDRAIVELAAAGPSDLKVIAAWNSTGTVFEADAAQAQMLIERKVRECPEAIAVSDGGARWTYQTLWDHAGAIAARLMKRNLAVGARVGIGATPSAELIAAIIGIWRAGGVCVPLDLQQPRERIETILAASGSGLVLGSPQIAPLLPGFAEAIGWGPGSEAGPPQRPCSPDELAYIVHTSGSTGRPKGVALPHRALVNLALWQTEGQSAPPLRTAQFSSPIFDVFFQELLVCLASGGELVIVESSERRDPELLLDRCRAAEVERLFLPYVALREIAEAGCTAKPLPALREVITAGEQLQITPALRAWMGAHPDCRLLNHYGPSETHVATAEPLGSDPAEWPELPAIGRPIANLRCQILDERLNPVPPGIPGELFLGGAALARGYWDSPSLTAERFIPDPFTADGSRLYRTGDRALWLEDGRIAFLGRLDDQAKIRGYRVEPGEVEAALSSLASVRQAVVLVERDEEGRAELLAYALPATRSVDSGEIRESLRSKLPDYMVPARIQLVDTFPRTATGKIDRRALARLPRAQKAIAPRPEGAAALIAQLWSDILGTPVGPDDNFFAAGGHSLAAARVAARLREQLGSNVPLRLLFDHPTAAELARALSDSAPARQGGSGITRMARDGSPSPLSFAQAGMWFLDRLAPGSVAYNLAHTIALGAYPDREALAAAVEALVRRHKSLRTVFPEVDGSPAQLVTAGRGVRLDIADLSFLAGGEVPAELQELIHDELRRPFDLARGPLLRASLLDFGRNGSFLLLGLHHIIADAASLLVVERDLKALYEAYWEGRTPSLPDLIVQYPDFAAWQRRTLSGRKLDRLLASVRARIGEAPRLLSLSGRGAAARGGEGDAGGRCGLAIPAASFAALRRLAAEEGATPFMACAAAFLALVGRYADEEEFLIGTPIGARDDPALEQSVGLFVNLLVLRADLSGDPTFRELVRRVREDSVAAYAASELPFDRLVEALQPRRGLDTNPLVQVSFGYHHAEEFARAGDRLRAAPDLSLSSAAGNGTSKFDLSLVLVESEDGIAGILEFKRALLSEEQAERMARTFERIAEQAAAGPDLPVSGLFAAHGREVRQLLKWGKGEPAELSDGGVAAAVRKIAQQDPCRPAIEAPDGDLDYRSLDASSDALAVRLAAAGWTNEARIGVLLGNCASHPVAFLGVLKAGAVYVPLDPALPADRLRQLINESGLSCILTMRPSIDMTGLPVWEIGKATEPIEGAPPRPPLPDQLAYIIFTSGSTGRPKGVMITHRGLASLIAAEHRVLGLSPSDRVLKFARPSFDAAIFEMTCAFAAGAVLCLESEDRLLPGPELTSLLRERRISMATLTPSTLSLVPPEPLSDLKLLFTAGEACSGRLVDEWAASRRMINGYGPTETSVWASYAECRRASGDPPIGGPVPNSQLRVVGRNLDLLAPGLPGELCIAGDGLARGYLDRPARTAASFVPDPHGPPGSRMYRTGDLVRWRRDGRLQFLGRLDDQIKVRGARVELGEVESAIGSLPGVAYAVAVARPDREGQIQLIAYAVARDGANLAERAMLAELRKRLPPATIPSRILLPKSLPRTPSGKVDRQRLPEPRQSRRPRRRPGSPAARVCDLCSELLGTRAAPADNFFALGGHSLLATRLVARLREELGVEVPVRRLFEADTIGHFCAELFTGNKARHDLSIERLARSFAKGAPLVPFE